MTPQHPFLHTTRSPGQSQRHRGQGLVRPRPLPLTDDQYVATSLALVAQLSQRVRGGGVHPS